MYWKPRERNFNSIIGRIHAISPRETKKYYLRMLPYHVRGATKHEDIKTVDGVEYLTFREAARAARRW
jgi:hypothetical protein